MIANKYKAWTVCYQKGPPHIGLQTKIFKKLSLGQINRFTDEMS